MEKNRVTGRHNTAVRSCGKGENEMSDNYSTIGKLLAKKDAILREGKLAVLCNQTSFDFLTGRYLFQLLGPNLKRVFIPEHGLFAELQDQIPLSDASDYSILRPDVEFISLYGETESTLFVRPDLLRDLDALILDIADVGSRYYTFATTVSYIFDTIAREKLKLKIYILDRFNPAGRQVEGTILPAEYQSFVGRPGLIHRHGLTMGELCLFYKKQIGYDFDLEIIPPQASLRTWEIAPSPNMPGPATPLVYPGQCLLEGANLSEGRGTTRPFEIFGAPYMRWIHQKKPIVHPGCTLRPLRFIPTFHKYKGQICEGFQIHIAAEPYHSLGHTLRLLRWIRENSRDSFEWLKGVYEFRSDRPAIEILCGDSAILEYLNGNCGYQRIRQLMEEAELRWIREVTPLLLYDSPLLQADPGQEN